MLGRKKANGVDLASRRAVLWMHPQAVLNMMTSQRWVVTKGHLPADVTFHSVFWDPMRNVWGVVCQSKTFKPLKLNEPMPELEQVEFRGYDPKRDGVLA